MLLHATRSDTLGRRLAHFRNGRVPAVSNDAAAHEESQQPASPRRRDCRSARIARVDTLFALASMARSSKRWRRSSEIPDRLLTTGSDRRQLANTANRQTTAFAQEEASGRGALLHARDWANCGSGSHLALRGGLLCRRSRLGLRLRSGRFVESRGAVYCARRRLDDRAGTDGGWRLPFVRRLPAASRYGFAWASYWSLSTV